MSPEDQFAVEEEIDNNAVVAKLQNDEDYLQNAAIDKEKEFNMMILSKGEVNVANAKTNGFDTNCILNVWPKEAQLLVKDGIKAKRDVARNQFMKNGK
jgi:hypothetical protein